MPARSVLLDELARIDVFTSLRTSELRSLQRRVSNRLTQLRRNATDAPDENALLKQRLNEIKDALRQSALRDHAESGARVVDALEQIQVLAAGAREGVGVMRDAVADVVPQNAEQAGDQAVEAEEEHIAAEKKAEEERIAAEKAEEDRIAAEKAEEDRIAAEKASEAKPAEEAVNVGLEEAKAAEEAFNTGLEEEGDDETSSSSEVEEHLAKSAPHVSECSADSKAEHAAADGDVSDCIADSKAERATADGDVSECMADSKAERVTTDGDVSVVRECIADYKAEQTTADGDVSECIADDKAEQTTTAGDVSVVSECSADDKAEDIGADGDVSVVSECSADDKAEDTAAEEPPPKRLRASVGDDNLGVHKIYDDFKTYKIYLQEGKYDQGLLLAKIAKLLHRVIINVRTCTRMLRTDLSDEERHRWDICFLQNTAILKIMSSYIADRRM